jgi:hypothetical protein
MLALLRRLRDGYRVALSAAVRSGGASRSGVQIAGAAGRCRSSKRILRTRLVTWRSSKRSLLDSLSGA